MKKLFSISRVTLLFLSVILIHSCKKDKPTVPSITTADVTAITYTTATSGGDLKNDGGAAKVSIGVCWNTSAAPTITDSKTINSLLGGQTSGSGSFVSQITMLTSNTTYYVRAYATNSVGTSYGNEVSFTTLPAAVPVLTTTAITSITKTTATSGGNITADNGGFVTASGVCWSTSASPTIALTTKTTNNTGKGVFTSSITGLTAGTTYYVRAYATNSAGAGYGNEMIFKTYAVMDIEGIGYNSVTIGTQIWMTENLKTSKYRNGDFIGTTTPATLDISGESTPKYQWAYAGNESYVATNGRLYTCYAVTDSRVVCPLGWHVPTDSEWTTLTDFLGGSSVAGGKLKEAGTSYWSSPNNGATNETGFSSLPGGYRSPTGSFGGIGISGFWWSSIENSTGTAFFRCILNGYSNVYSNNGDKKVGNSIRCLKD